MDVSYLLDSLNDKQREAVARHAATFWCWRARAVVRRAYGASYRLADERGKLLAILDYGVTFTNKAAAEMRHRIGQLMAPARAACGSAPSTGWRTACCCAPYGRQSAAGFPDPR